MPWLIKFLVFFNAVAFGWGYARPPGAAELVLSSQESDLTRSEAYANIPCPDASQLQKLKKQFKLEIDFTGWTCTDDDVRTTTIKSFMVIDKMSFEIPANWDPALKSKFAQIDRHLTGFTENFTIDFVDASPTVAYYKPTSKNISLTERTKFFSPLDNILVLVHENRHAERPDISHTQCLAGDLPRFIGACDEYFSTIENEMGAYNFTIFYEAGLGLYGKNLKESEREYLKSLALSELTNRMNIIPKLLGHFNDVIAALGPDSKLYLVHPFTHALVPTSAELPPGQQIQRVEYNTSENGVTLFTDKEMVFSWAVTSGVNSILEKPLANRRIHDLLKGRIQFRSGEVMWIVLENGKAFYVGFEEATKKYELKPYPVFKSTENDPKDFRRIVFGHYDETYFISEDGKIHRVAYFGQDPNYEALSQMQSSSSEWIGGTGGALYSSLFLYDRHGGLFQVKIENKRGTMLGIDSEEAPEKITKEKMNFGEAQVIKKYLQSTGFEAALNDRGQLMIRKYGHKKETTLRTSQPMTDFVIYKSLTVPPSVLGFSSQPNPEFVAQCQLIKAKVDPWLHRGIGLDSHGQIVFEGQAPDLCTKLSAVEPVTDFEFIDEMSAQDRDAIDINNRHHMFYARPVIKLRTVTGYRILRPYEN